MNQLLLNSMRCACTIFLVVCSARVGQHCSDTLAGLMKRSVHCWTVSMGLVTVCPLVFGDMKIS